MLRDDCTLTFDYLQQGQIYFVVLIIFILENTKPSDFLETTLVYSIRTRIYGQYNEYHRQSQSLTFVQGHSYFNNFKHLFSCGGD